MRSHSLTRRIHVREQRSNGEWRTRAVDHCTESLLNDATQPCDATTNDPVMLLIQILLVFMMHGVAPVAWKRDISKAYRRVLPSTKSFPVRLRCLQGIGNNVSIGAILLCIRCCKRSPWVAPYWRRRSIPGEDPLLCTLRKVC